MTLRLTGHANYTAGLSSLLGRWWRLSRPRDDGWGPSRTPSFAARPRPHATEVRGMLHLNRGPGHAPRRQRVRGMRMWRFPSHMSKSRPPTHRPACAPKSLRFFPRSLFHSRDWTASFRAWATSRTRRPEWNAGRVDVDRSVKTRLHEPSEFQRRHTSGRRISGQKASEFQEPPPTSLR